MRFDSRPPCGPAASSSEPTLPALAASAPEVSAPLPTSVCDDGPGLIFLLLQPALHSAAATIRMISIFRIPYSTLLPLVRQQIIERTVPRRGPGLRPARPSVAILSGHRPKQWQAHRDCPPVPSKSA